MSIFTSEQMRDDYSIEYIIEFWMRQWFNLLAYFISLVYCSHETKSTEALSMHTKQVKAPFKFNLSEIAFTTKGLSQNRYCLECKPSLIEFSLKIDKAFESELHGCDQCVRVCLANVIATVPLCVDTTIARLPPSVSTGTGENIKVNKLLQRCKRKRKSKSPITSSFLCVCF